MLINVYTLTGYKRNERITEDGKTQISYNFYLSSDIVGNGDGLETFELWQPITKVHFEPVVGMILNAIVSKRGNNFYIDHLEP